MPDPPVFSSYDLELAAKTHLQSWHPYWLAVIERKYGVTGLPRVQDYVILDELDDAPVAGRPVITITSVNTDDDTFFTADGGSSLPWRLDVAVFLSDPDQHRLIRWYVAAARHALLSRKIAGASSMTFRGEAYDEWPGDEETRGYAAGSVRFTAIVDGWHDSTRVPPDPPDPPDTPPDDEDAVVEHTVLNVERFDE